jgi:WD40 repeat protein
MLPLVTLASLSAQDDKANLPAGALMRLGDGRARVTNNIMGVAMSPDGRMLAYPGNSGEIHLIDPITAKEIAQLPSTVYGQTLAFSPDSKRLAVASYNLQQGVAILEVPTGKQLAHFTDNNNQLVNLRISSVSFSKDGSRLALCSDNYNNQKNNIQIREVPSGKLLQTVDIGIGQQTKAVIFPDGTKVMSWTSQATFINNQQHPPALTVWDVNGGKELYKHTFERMNISAAAVSPDGKHIVASSGQSAYYLFDAESGREVDRFAGRKGMVQGMQFSPDGKFLYSGSQEGVIQHWETSSWKRMPQVEVPRHRVASFGFRDDGRVLAAGTDNNSVAVIDARTGAPLQGKQGHHYPVRSLTFLDNEQLVSTSADGKICWWNLSDGKETKHIYLREDDVARVNAGMIIRNGHFVVSQDGKFVAGGSEYNNNIVRLWDLSSGQIVCDFDALRMYSGSPSAATSFSFSADGSKMAGLSQRAVHVWNVSTGKEFPPLKFEEEKVNPNQGNQYPNGLSVALSPNGQFVAAGRMFYVNGQQTTDYALWDLERKVRVINLNIPNQNTGMPPMVTFSPNSKLLAIPQPDRSIPIVKTSNGKEVQRLVPPQSGAGAQPLCLAFSPDGRLVTGIYTYYTSSKPMPVPGNPGAFRTTSVQTSRLVLWEVASGAIRQEFDYQSLPLQSVAFSPDGKVLATGSQDASIVLWDIVGKLTPTQPFKREELGKAWDALLSKQGQSVFKEQMRRMIAAAGETVSFIGEKVKPAKVQEVNRDELAKWLGDLDSETFTVRSQATKALEQLGDAIEADLQKALEKANSLEAQRRLQGLLDRMKAKELTEDQMRQVRAIEILERIATPEARTLLQRYAEGAPQARLTQDAREALERLKPAK